MLSAAHTCSWNQPACSMTLHEDTGPDCKQAGTGADGARPADTRGWVCPIPGHHWMGLFHAQKLHHKHSMHSCIRNPVLERYGPCNSGPVAEANMPAARDQELTDSAKHHHHSLTTTTLAPQAASLYWLGHTTGAASHPSQRGQSNMSQSQQGPGGPFSA
jgi:hypothetical protein